MDLIRRIRMALSDALRPEPEPAPSLVKIVAADKLQCDLSLLEALAESERWNFTVEMLQERQTRLGETLTFEIEASKLHAPKVIHQGPKPFADHPVPPKTGPFSDTEGFGEPRAEVKP